MQRCHLSPGTTLYFVIKQDSETMALLREKRSGMQNIFLQANCKMHEANYPNSAAYAQAGRIVSVCSMTPSGVQAVAALHGAQRPLFGLSGTWEEEEHEEGC